MEANRGFSLVSFLILLIISILVVASTWMGYSKIKTDKTLDKSAADQIQEKGSFRKCPDSWIIYPDAGGGIAAQVVTEVMIIDGEFVNEDFADRDWIRANCKINKPTYAD